MSFLSRILGRNTPPETGVSGASERATRLFSQGCYCGSLWWATKGLEASPSSLEARNIFEKAIEKIMVSFTLRIPADKKTAEEIKLRLANRRMTPAEAEETADWTIKLFFHNRILEESESLLKPGAVLGETEFCQARMFAAAFIGEEGAKGCRHVQWSSVLDPTVLNHDKLNSSIRRECAALARMYRTSTEEAFLEACADFSNLYSSAHPEFAVMFQKISQEGLDMPFDEFRNKLERIFAKNAVDFMLMLAATLQPA